MVYTCTCNLIYERDSYFYFWFNHVLITYWKINCINLYSLNHDEFYHNMIIIYIEFLSPLGAGDCIFTFLAVHTLSRSQRNGGEESQDFPENPYVLHCSHYKVHSPFGKLYTVIF